MPRLPRIHVPGGFYHVILRGNHRQDIFFCDEDRQLLESIVGEIISRFCARVHAYCWMTNHIHLLIQVSDYPLGAIMLRIASRYARAVQSRFSTTGHLFERRYRALLVDADSYLLQLVRYIHLNPVRAHLVIDPLDYRWSSHRTYLGKENTSWVTTDATLRLFHSERIRAVEAYGRFMGEHAADENHDAELAPHPHDGRILGDDQFLFRILGTEYIPRSRETLQEIVAKSCVRFEVTEESLISSSKARHLVAARAWVAHHAVRHRIASICAIARHFNRSESAIRQIMAHHSYTTI